MDGKLGLQACSVEDGGFELVEGEDESLPWKCAACEFIDPVKQVVVDHWQRHHCSAQVYSCRYAMLVRAVKYYRRFVE